MVLYIHLSYLKTFFLLFPIMVDMHIHSTEPLRINDSQINMSIILLSILPVRHRRISQEGISL